MLLALRIRWEYNPAILAENQVLVAFLPHRVATLLILCRWSDCLRLVGTSGCSCSKPCLSRSMHRRLPHLYGFSSKTVSLKEKKIIIRKKYLHMVPIWHLQSKVPSGVCSKSNSWRLHFLIDFNLQGACAQQRSPWAAGMMLIHGLAINACSNSSWTN